MIIYLKQGCSTCKKAVDLLKENKCEYEVREYLVDPPSKKELKELVEKIGCKPVDLVRKKEKLYQENYCSKKYTDSQWLTILSKNPILIERPILIDDEQAIIGRPPELILKLTEKK